VIRAAEGTIRIRPRITRLCRLACRCWCCPLWAGRRGSSSRRKHPRWPTGPKTPQRPGSSCLAV